MISLPQIEQIAIASKTPQKTIAWLKKFGLKDWSMDIVECKGSVYNEITEHTVAELYFNYDLGYEFEILNYIDGLNWHDYIIFKGETFLSHKGIHATLEELERYRVVFAKQGIKVAQEVVTKSHTNPIIKDERRYKYIIFNTRDIFGFDFKVISRLNLDYTPYIGP